jgi:hypothetical protein
VGGKRRTFRQIYFSKIFFSQRYSPKNNSEFERVAMLANFSLLPTYKWLRQCLDKANGGDVNCLARIVVANLS